MKIHITPITEKGNDVIANLYIIKKILDNPAIRFGLRHATRSKLKELSKSGISVNSLDIIRRHKSPFHLLPADKGIIYEIITLNPDVSRNMNKIKDSVFSLIESCGGSLEDCEVFIYG